MFKPTRIETCIKKQTPSAYAHTSRHGACVNPAYRHRGPLEAAIRLLEDGDDVDGDALGHKSRVANRRTVERKYRLLHDGPRLLPACGSGDPRPWCVTVGIRDSAARNIADIPVKPCRIAFRDNTRYSLEMSCQCARWVEYRWHIKTGGRPRRAKVCNAVT